MQFGFDQCLKVGVGLFCVVPVEVRKEGLLSPPAHPESIGAL